MKVEIIKAEKNEIEFKIIGERHTVPGLLKHYLVRDPHVVFASYLLEHPVVGYPRMIVKTDGKEDAKTAIKKAIEAIEADLKQLAALA